VIGEVAKKQRIKKDLRRGREIGRHNKAIERDARYATNEGPRSREKRIFMRGRGPSCGHVTTNENLQIERSGMEKDFFFAEK